MDALLEQSCDHVVSGVLYSLTTCPRCLGEGSYKDIKYGVTGLVITVAGADKLKQDILKTLATSATPFHPEYGAQLKTRIGQLFDPDVAKAVVKADLIQAVHSFMSIQEGAPNLLPSENVKQVLNARTWILSTEPRRVYGSIVVETESAVPVTLNTEVNL